MDNVSGDLAVFLRNLNSDILIFGVLALSVIALLFALAAFVRCRRCRSRMSALEAKVHELQSAEEARFHADLVARGILATGDSVTARAQE